MISKLTDLQKLSRDVYNGSVQKYSKDEAELAIKTAVIEACGGEWNIYSFQENKYKVFAIMSEVLSIGLGELLTGKFDEFVETRDTDLGDTIEFDVEDNSLFKVATIADGNTDIRRQKIYGTKLTVATELMGVKIYEELDKFIAGRINWSKMIDKVMQSYAHEVAVKIYNAIYGSYSALVAPYKVNAVYDKTTLTDMIAHIEASTGQKAVVFGTKKALGKITDATPSERMKDELNMMGHYGYVAGTALLELPQAHLAGTDTFGVNDSFLLVVPNGEKIVKLILEGDAYVYDTPAGVRNDSQLEFFFGRKAGVAVLISRNFAIYQLA